MDDAEVDSAGTHEPQVPRTPRKAAISSWIGSALEYYDFFIYGTAAALVFPKIFFPTGNPAAATIASLATFGVAYVARPVGSFIFGHLGDTIGRKKVLVITLFGMGTATFLIGVLPTYNQIGFAAPILLLILRLCQGLAVSGEQSSASSTTLEHAPPNRRAYFTSFTLAGTQGGNILAAAAFLPIAALPEDALLSWGWRIPFLLSAVVMAVGWWIRRSLGESPAFEEEQEHHDIPKAPLKVLFRTYTPDVLKVLFAALASVNSTIFGQFALAYGVNTMGMSRPAFLWLAIIVNAIALFAIPAAGYLADRFGRKPVYVTGMLGTAVMIWPFLWAVSQTQSRAGLLVRHSDGLDLLQRVRRSRFRAVERAIRYQGADVGSGRRNPVRVRAGRVRTLDRGRARRAETRQLGVRSPSSRAQPLSSR